MARYRLLTEAEVRVLVVEDKWLATIRQEVRTELDRISQRLTVRVKELAERYGETLPCLTDEVELLTAKVDGHLQLLMGV
jgi:type I restriction enzyme M protein